MVAYNLFFGFEGRFGRAIFWALGIPVGIVLWAFLDIGQAVWTQSHGSILRLVGAGVVWLLATFIASVAATASCAIAARRLHDRNKSSSWLFLFYGVPALIWVAPCHLLPDMPALLLGAADVAILAWQVVELGFMRGTVGTNEYGPDPLLADLRDRVVANAGWSLR